MAKQQQSPLSTIYIKPKPTAKTRTKVLFFIALLTAGLFLILFLALIVPERISSDQVIIIDPRAVKKEGKKHVDAAKGIGIFKARNGNNGMGKNMGWSKDIIIGGNGLRYPKKGDIVSVHYEGKLEDGTLFDSSRGRGRSYETVIGEGKLIRGWEEGLLTMTVGEVARFKIHPSYAYGSKGSPPLIPPNATLIFEVEMISIKTAKLEL